MDRNGMDRVVGFSSKVIFWKKIQRGWELLQGEVAIIALL